MDEKQTTIKTTFEMWGRDEETVSVLPFGQFRENRKKRWRKHAENMWNILVLQSFFGVVLNHIKAFTGR